MFDLAVIFGLGIPELVIILVIVLLIFGAPAIPRLGKAIGETIKGIRSASKGVQEGSKEGRKEEEESKKL